MSPACLLSFLPGLISRTFMVFQLLPICPHFVVLPRGFSDRFIFRMYMYMYMCCRSEDFSDHPNFQASSITIPLFYFSSLDFCDTVFWYLSRHIIVYFFIIHFTYYNLCFIQSNPLTITERVLRRLLLNVYGVYELLPGRVSHPLVCLIFFLLLPIFSS